MFYITKKNSDTGNKFTELLQKKEIAINAQKEIATKYGFNQYRGAGFSSVLGGISSCLDFNNEPDKKIWGKGSDIGEFFPKRNSKAGKAIFNEIEQMPRVTKNDLNSCIGFVDAGFSHIGFAHNNDIYYGFTCYKS